LHLSEFAFQMSLTYCYIWVFTTKDEYLVFRG
jgi:hypothetical protein